MSPVNNANIDVLAERVDTAITGFAKIEGMISAMTANQQSLVSQIAVFQERMAQVHITVQRQSNVIDAQGEDIEKIRDEQKRMSEDVSNQKQSWRIFGAIALFLATSALGLAGWLSNTVGITDRRVSVLEFALGMRNVLPQALQTVPGTKP